MAGRLRAASSQLQPLAQKVLAFLEPDPDKREQWLQEPELAPVSRAPAVQAAAKRLKLAASRKEKIIVAGDYDADGILGTAILVDALRRQGIQAGFYIPDRIREGYGLKEKTVQMAHDKGYTLLVTVDNGVLAHEALQKAADLGMDVIVTDHHQYEQEPQAGWFVHPAVMEPVFATLCGAAVAYEIIRAASWDTAYDLELAGLASVGDQMQVTGETRALIAGAVSLLNTHPDPHIVNLAGPGPLNETDLSFQVIPKINALGRLSNLANANNAVRYFLSRDPVQIQSLAAGICQVNDRRKDMSRQMVKEIASRMNPADPVIFVEDPAWHEGIVGLAAGAISEQTGKPVIVASRVPGGYKASMRGPEGTDCMQLLKGFDRFTALGGHARAAGMSFDLEDKAALTDYLSGLKVPAAVRKPALTVKPEDLTVSAIRQLDVLRPFGTGFELPRMRLEDPDIVRTTELSQGKHRKYLLSNGLEALRFNQPAQEHVLNPARIRALEGRPAVHVWMQAATPQLIVSDLDTDTEKEN